MYLQWHEMQNVIQPYLKIIKHKGKEGYYELHNYIDKACSNGPKHNTKHRAIGSPTNKQNRCETIKKNKEESIVMLIYTKS